MTNYSFPSKPSLCNIHHRVPLVRKQSLRQKLIEHGLLEDYLKTHTFNPASKYFKEVADLTATQPLENYMDVSAQAGGRGSSGGLGDRGPQGS